MRTHEPSDLIGVGIYSVPEASRLSGIAGTRLRRWMLGYEFDLHGSKKQSPRVIEGELPTVTDTLALSFLDLQEARCIAEFRKRQVGWPAIRAAHEQAKIDLGTDHPFSTGQFKTLGRRLMWDAATDEADGVLLDLTRNQTSFRSVLAPYLRGLTFLDNRPVLWFPLENSSRVVVDPKRGFGLPIVARRGVQTSILMSAYRAEKSYEKVAYWYEVDVRSVKDAVRYERALAA